MHPNNVPRLRFARELSNDSLEWGKYFFGDIGKVLSCKRIYKDETASDGEIPFYKIGSFGKSPDSYINKELYEDMIEEFKILKDK